jgi:iron complex transport system ATP-binding protein
MTATSSGLRAERLTLAYDRRRIIEDLSVEIQPGRITVIIGANACGKSTLLRGLARMLKPEGGGVFLDSESIHRLPTKEVARRLGLLPQSPSAPEGISVEDLVGRGRYPHQGLFDRWTPEDEAKVEEAMAATGTSELRDRPVDELSGGQRQRAWIALALAQDTPIMLLDEPTTFLDLAHQIEVLDLVEELNEREGRTIVMVLHDLNQACRYAHHVIAMKQGAIYAQGDPREIISADVVRDVFGLDVRVIADEVSGTPLCLPLGRRFGGIALAAGRGDGPPVS